MACHACPIHNLQIFGLDHYAMHPSLNNSAYCTCALNFIPPPPYKRRSASVAALTTEDVRLDAKVNGLDCTSNIGWSRIMAYATPEECVRTYAQLSFAFGPPASKRLPTTVWILRKKMVMAYLTPAERLGVFSLVSSQAKVGASSLKRTAKFTEKQLVLADGSNALDRLEAASIRFPALKDVRVSLGEALSDSQNFTDANRALILAKLCTFTFVTNLALDTNDIAVLPDAANASIGASIGALTNLKRLSLSWNKIHTLPASICLLTAMKELYLSNNQLTALPDVIGQLTGLERLNLSYNKISTLPDGIGELTNLKELCLANNPVERVPDLICNMVALTTLDLSNNQLTALPDRIGQLTGLETLSLYNNQLTALPESIVALTNLTTLYLNDNRDLNYSKLSPAVQQWLQVLELSSSPTSGVSFPRHWERR